MTLTAIHLRKYSIDQCMMGNKLTEPNHAVRDSVLFCERRGTYATERQRTKATVMKNTNAVRSY